MQVFLAQARGPRRNAELVCQSVDLMLAIRAARNAPAGAKMMENALVETLAAAVRALEQTGIPYAITGSIASGVHGEPVMSQDVDLVVLATAEQAAALAARLQPRFYAPVELLTDGVARHSFANIVDNRTGLKVDLSFIPPAGFLSIALARRVPVSLGPAAGEFWFVTAEDVILMKLLWRKDTGSRKQWENALAVARVRGTRMDWNYLFATARSLGIEDQLGELRDEAGI
jgi:hypothetical protein